MRDRGYHSLDASDASGVAKWDSPVRANWRSPPARVRPSARPPRLARSQTSSPVRSRPRDTRAVRRAQQAYGRTWTRHARTARRLHTNKETCSPCAGPPLVALDVRTMRPAAGSAWTCGIWQSECLPLGCDGERADELDDRVYIAVDSVNRLVVCPNCNDRVSTKDKVSSSMIILLPWLGVRGRGRE